MIPTSDVAFSASVKAVQTQRGSREMFQRMEAQGGFRNEISDDLAAVLAEIDTAYLVTASADAQPYAQHRGGPKGFIRILGPQTLGFADYAGNRQYISIGNLAENEKAFLFLMDYAHRRRIKIWGRARVVTDDRDLINKLMPAAYRAKPDQAILFEVEAWDINCPQHIPQKLNADDVAAAVARLQARITALETETADLTARLGNSKL